MADILRVLVKNVSLAKIVVERIVPRLKTKSPSPLAADALVNAILTKEISLERREELQAIIGRYL